MNVAEAILTARMCAEPPAQVSGRYVLNSVLLHAQIYTPPKDTAVVPGEGTVETTPEREITVAVVGADGRRMFMYTADNGFVSPAVENLLVSEHEARKALPDTDENRSFKLWSVCKKTEHPCGGTTVDIKIPLDFAGQDSVLKAIAKKISKGYAKPQWLSLESVMLADRPYTLGDVKIQDIVSVTLNVGGDYVTVPTIEGKYPIYEKVMRFPCEVLYRDVAAELLWKLSTQTVFKRSGFKEKKHKIKISTQCYDIKNLDALCAFGDMTVKEGPESPLLFVDGNAKYVLMPIFGVKGPVFEYIPEYHE